MGLGIDFVEAVLREHCYRPVSGDVLLIGRQTVYSTPAEVLELMVHHGISPCLHREEIELDKETLNRRSDAGENRELISDRSFFQLLGAKSVCALDHSDYEGAEVVHDLTRPIPEQLHAIADFIVDGSTLDNTFNPSLTIRNFAELLRPGGRILMINMLSDTYAPYTIQPPLWYLDYFTVNKFIDCKVYILVYTPDGVNAFCINYDWLMDGEHLVSNFVSPHRMEVIVFAEKGPDSSAEACPVQQHYRSQSGWKIYRRNLATIIKSPRPHLVHSRSPISFLNSAGGHLFLNSNCEAVDPGSEAKQVKLTTAVQTAIAAFKKHESFEASGAIASGNDDTGQSNSEAMRAKLIMAIQKAITALEKHRESKTRDL